MLYIEPVSGLANRMRVIAASRLLLNEVGLPESESLQCIWRKTDDLAADYLDLFEYPTNFQLCEPFNFHLRSTYKEQWYKKLKSHLWDKLRGGVDCYYSCNDINKIMKVGTPSQKNGLFFERIKKDIIKNQKVCFTGCQYLMDLNEVTIFSPQKRIMDIIDDYCADFNNLTYGLHIRRTDNSAAIINSPILLFKKR